jgi:phosphoribosylamine---glycine ligase
MKKRLLIIGSGGREHAIAWKCASAETVEKVYVAPGNAGTSQEDKVENVAIDVLNIDALIDFAKQQNIDLTIIGPEAPLAAGIVDRFNENQLKCFGPSQAAAQLETSKAFCKAFLAEEKIPTAEFSAFTDKQAALNYAKKQPLPMVIKASGLAAGKGVIIAETQQQAEEAITAMLDDQRFGDAGHEIIIEAFLTGEELSFIVMVDGQHILPLASSQDHKRRDNGDKGPNTGGMGAYSPAPLLTPELRQHIMQDIIEPTVKALARRGTPYQGFLYAGLMISATGQAKVLEYNCRLGDPETQPLLIRLQSDLVDLCEAAVDGQLNQKTAQWDPRPAICVVLAAGGYPDSYQKGHTIEGLNAEVDSNCKIFHAGSQEQDGNIVTHGGRVLGITALGDDLQAARNTAYELAKKVHWPDYYYRDDIGHRALAQTHSS